MDYIALYNGCMAGDEESLTIVYNIFIKTLKIKWRKNIDRHDLKDVANNAMLRFFKAIENQKSCEAILAKGEKLPASMSKSITTPEAFGGWLASHIRFSVLHYWDDKQRGWLKIKKEIYEDDGSEKKTEIIKQSLFVPLERLIKKDGKESVPVEGIFDPHNNPCDNLAKAQNYLNEILLIIEKMSARCRMLLTIYFRDVKIEGVSQYDAANNLKMSRGTFVAGVSDCKKKLRSMPLFKRLKEEFYL